jgi:citrate synthase
MSAGWRQVGPQASRLINAALILCADHELNVSSFAARVAASGEAQPYAVVAAGLAALQGAKHGGMTRRAEALLREIGRPGQVDQAITDRLRRGETIPGFGHPLYPDGDPRARLLLGLVRETALESPAIRLVDLVCARMLDAVQLAPTIDLALAALALTLDLPADSAVCLFAVGRTVGWVGHAIEQYERGQLIRPRASYVGLPVRRGHQPGNVAGEPDVD